MLEAAEGCAGILPTAVYALAIRIKRVSFDPGVFAGSGKTSRRCAAIQIAIDIADDADARRGKR